jgi:DNA-binding transcriptional LysR family regulator
MELRQIKSFLSIAETLHFGRTAKLIHLSQPALTLQIQALEEAVGVKLLERNRRGTKVTAAGLAFREHAIAAVAQVEQAVRRARLAANGKAGLLRVGFISTAGNEIMPNLIRHFGDSNPEIEFSLQNILTLGQIQMLNAGSLDVGFLRLPIGEHSELEVVPIHREPFVFVVPASHRLADKEKVHIREVAAEEFVMCERTVAPDCHGLIFGMLRDAGVVPTVRQTAEQMPTLISLVASGLGISVLPASAVKHSGAAVAACEIADVIPMSEIGLAVSKRNRLPIVETFRSFALKELVRINRTSRVTMAGLLSTTSYRPYGITAAFCAKR